MIFNLDSTIKKILILPPHHGIFGGETQIKPKLTQKELNYNFETLHELLSNQKNEIWT